MAETLDHPETTALQDEQAHLLVDITQGYRYGYLSYDEISFALWFYMVTKEDDGHLLSNVPLIARMIKRTEKQVRTWIDKLCAFGFLQKERKGRDRVHFLCIPEALGKVAQPLPPRDTFPLPPKPKPKRYIATAGEAANYILREMTRKKVEDYKKKKTAEAQKAEAEAEAAPPSNNPADPKPFPRPPHILDIIKKLDENERRLQTETFPPVDPEVLQAYRDHRDPNSFPNLPLWNRKKFPTFEIATRHRGKAPYRPSPIKDVIKDLTLMEDVEEAKAILEGREPPPKKKRAKGNGKGSSKDSGKAGTKGKTKLKFAPKEEPKPIFSAEARKEIAKREMLDRLGYEQSPLPEAPPKRPRGRPRKYPRPEEVKAQLAQAAKERMEKERQDETPEILLPPAIALGGYMPKDLPPLGPIPDPGKKEELAKRAKLAEKGLTLEDVQLFPKKKPLFGDPKPATRKLDLHSDPLYCAGEDENGRRILRLREVGWTFPFPQDMPQMTRDALQDPRLPHLPFPATYEDYIVQRVGPDWQDLTQNAFRKALLDQGWKAYIYERKHLDAMVAKEIEEEAYHAAQLAAFVKKTKEEAEAKAIRDQKLKEERRLRYKAYFLTKLKKDIEAGRIRKGAYDENLKPLNRFLNNRTFRGTTTKYGKGRPKPTDENNHMFAYEKALLGEHYYKKSQPYDPEAHIKKIDPEKFLKERLAQLSSSSAATAPPAPSVPPPTPHTPQMPQGPQAAQPHMPQPSVPQPPIPQPPQSSQRPQGPQAAQPHMPQPSVPQPSIQQPPQSSQRPQGPQAAQPHMPQMPQGPQVAQPHMPQRPQGSKIPQPQMPQRPQGSKTPQGSKIAQPQLFPNPPAPKVETKTETVGGPEDPHQDEIRQPKPYNPWGDPYEGVPPHLRPKPNPALKDPFDYDPFADEEDP